jgi:4-aminobutyrate aminotransferase
VCATQNRFTERTFEPGWAFVPGICVCQRSKYPGTVSRRPLIRTPLPGPNARRLIERDSGAMSPSFTRAYPFVMDSGEGCWVTDVDGNTFLDFTAGIAVCSTGHSHPRVVEAITRQAARFLHMSGTDFYYRVEIELAERLATRMMGEVPARVFFTNSGAEAVEGAMKLARYATGRPNFLSFIGAFHGRTLGALSLTASKANQRRRFAPLIPSVFHAPYPSPSNGVTSEESFARIEELFNTVMPPDSVAAIFVEPIQGEGGYLVPQADFLPRLRDLTAAHGILLVTDEVQSGMGRSGRMLAAEHWDLQPDVICLAKGIASGLPLGAFVARAERMTWPPGSHGSTFGGNPLACAAALVTLDLLEEGLIDNAAEVGGQLLERLEELRQRHPAVITDVRGLGLMAALELDTQERAGELVQHAFNSGLLLLTAGKRAVRLSPPLVLNADEAAIGLEIIAESVSTLAGARDPVVQEGRR